MKFKLIIVVLFITNVFIIIKYFKQQSKLAYHVQTLTKKNALINKMKYYYINEKVKDGSKIDESFLIETFGQGKSSLKEILHNDVLVFKISETHCNSCLTEQVKFIQHYYSSTHNTEMIVFCDYLNIREIKAIFLSNNLEIKIFKIDQDIKLPLDYTKMPYLFMLNKNLKCRRLHIIMDESENETIKYLDNIE